MTDKEEEVLAREEFWADIDKRDTLKAKAEEDLRPLQMLGGAILYALCIILAVVAILFLIFGPLSARAATPAESTVIGVPASKRSACSEAERFVFRVVTLRDSGVPINEAIGMMVGAHVAAQMQIDPEVLRSRVVLIWPMQGDPKELSKLAFYLCMKDEMA